MKLRRGKVDDVKGPKAKSSVGYGIIPVKFHHNIEHNKKNQLNKSITSPVQSG